jgi:DNA-binding NtrC family response regulator
MAAKAKAAAPLTLQPPIDVVPWLATTRPPRQLVEDGELDPALAARFGDSLDAPVHLSRLGQRPEDLRSIVADRLAREGLRVRGRPIGIDDAAYALLVEHDFPGDDLELAALVERLVATAADDVVHAADVRAHLATTAAAGAAPMDVTLSRRNGA